MEQRTNKQVEAFIFRRDSGGVLSFLLMKRTPGRGGFWQPLTGGVRVKEELNNALLREIQEETGITEVKRIISTGYKFNFSDYGKNHTEYVYGIEVVPNVKVILSDEHDSYIWLPKGKVLPFLKWPGNIEGFHRLCSILE